MAAPTSLKSSFDLSSGITFDDLTGVLYGAADPNSLGITAPSSTLFIQHGNNPSLWQFDGISWAQFGTSAVPQYVLDVCTRLLDVGADLRSLATARTIYTISAQWAGTHIEDGDTVPVCGIRGGSVGQYIDGTIVGISYSGDIKTAGDLHVTCGTTDVPVAMPANEGYIATSIDVSGTVVLTSAGLDAKKLFVTLHYERTI
jgi:hypothetical protein